MPVDTRLVGGQPRRQPSKRPYKGLGSTPVAAKPVTRSVVSRSRPWQWLMILGLTSGSCLCLPLLVPAPAQAYVARMEITLDRQPEESYDTLLRRAEAAARAAAQRGFDRDVLVSELSIVILAQNRGLTAPILALQVSRTQWRSRPDSGLWITYFRTARKLLGFETGPAPATASGATPPAPAATPAPAPPAATTSPAPPPATSPATPAAPEPPAPSSPPPEPEASPIPSSPPSLPQLVIPQGSGVVPRIPTLPSQ